MAGVTTFDTLDTTNSALIRKALQGLIFVKLQEDSDTEVKQVYTTADGLILPSGYEHVGLINKKDGVKFARDTDSADVESWGKGQPTRRDITKDITTVQFTMQESRRQAFELYNGVDLSAVKADVENNLIIDKPSSPQSLDYRLFILSKDGDGASAIYWLDWLPNAMVTAAEDQTYTTEDELGYTVTMTGFEDPKFRTAHRKVWGGPGLDVTGMGFTKEPQA